jgi:hypothetical protein
VKLKKNSSIFFQKIEIVSLFIALYYTFRGHKVYYLYLSKFLEKERLYDFLEKKRIFGLSFEDQENAVYKASIRLFTLSDQVFEKLFQADPLKKRIEVAARIDKKGGGKWRMALISQVESKISDFWNLLTLANDYSEKEMKTIHLFATNNLYTRAVMDIEKSSFHNLCPPWFTILDAVALLLTILVKRVRVWSRFKNLIKSIILSIQPTSDSPNAPNCTPPEVTKYEIIYFPHKGIFYSNLFIKDHFFNIDSGSPFFRSKILHLSLGESDSILNRSHAYYEKMAIPFENFTKYFRIRSSFLIDFLRLCRKDWFGEFKQYRWSRILFFFKAYLLLQINLSACRYFRNTKIALIGYDILFPPFLSVALEINEIKTIAVQERFISAFWAINRIAVDYYFVFGEVIKEHLEKSSKFVAIEKIIPIGPIRLDLFYKLAQERVDPKYAAIKKKYTIILALDCHSAPNRFSNRLVVGATWKTNKRFYRDIIRLSEDIPDAYFVFKGKNTEVLENPEFSKLMNEIELLPNVAMETDLDFYTPEKMASIADAAVALHTNYGDEILATGKPVFFYDYIGIPTDWFDYEGHPVVVLDYEQLKKRVIRFVRGGGYMNEKSFTQMRKRFYGEHSYDGKVKERLHNELLAIHNNCSDKE